MTQPAKSEAERQEDQMRLAEQVGLHMEQLRTKGHNGERLFADWLDRQGHPYIYISQGKGDFSEFLKKTGAKRPDFLVFLPSMGVLAVDVKNKEPWVEPKTGKKLLSLSVSDDFRPAKNFSDLTSLPLWYAYVGTVCNDACDSWFFINTMGIEKFGNYKDGEHGDFFSINSEDFCFVEKGISGLNEYALRVALKNNS